VTWRMSDQLALAGATVGRADLHRHGEGATHLRHVRVVETVAPDLTEVGRAVALQDPRLQPTPLPASSARSSCAHQCSTANMRHPFCDLPFEQVIAFKQKSQLEIALTLASTICVERRLCDMLFKRLRDATAIGPAKLICVRIKRAVFDQLGSDQ